MAFNLASAMISVDEVVHHGGYAVDAAKHEYMVGSVLSVLRYPVKSMMGEELTAANVMEGGLAGDRAYALIDNSTGKIASAKNPRKWARLFDCHASFVEPPRKDHSMPPVRIMLPDASDIRSDQQSTNGILSRFFEREVTLAETAPESPALEEYWPDIDGFAHREIVTEESIALSSPKGSFFDYAVAHVITNLVRSKPPSCSHPH